MSKFSELMFQDDSNAKRKKAVLPNRSQNIFEEFFHCNGILPQWPRWIFRFLLWDNPNIKRIIAMAQAQQEAEMQAFEIWQPSWMDCKIVFCLNSHFECLLYDWLLLLFSDIYRAKFMQEWPRPQLKQIVMTCNATTEKLDLGFILHPSQFFQEHSCLPPFCLNIMSISSNWRKCAPQPCQMQIAIFCSAVPLGISQVWYKCRANNTLFNKLFIEALWK